MPRALAVHELSQHVALDDLQRRRDAARRAGANYWVFRDAGSGATLTEFVEAADETVVRAAVAALDRSPPLASPRFLVEVEL